MAVSRVGVDDDVTAAVADAVGDSVASTVTVAEPVEVAVFVAGVGLVAVGELVAVPVGNGVKVAVTTGILGTVGVGGSSGCCEHREINSSAVKITNPRINQVTYRITLI